MSKEPNLVLDLVFVDEAARAIYKTMLGNRIALTMRDEPEMQYDAIMDGRIGLNEMADADLIEFGLDCWGLEPTPGTVMEVAQL